MDTGFRNRCDSRRFHRRGAVIAGGGPDSRSVRAEDGLVLGDFDLKPRTGRHHVCRYHLAVLSVFRDRAHGRRRGAESGDLGFGGQLVCPFPGQGHGDHEDRRSARERPPALDGPVFNPGDGMEDGLGYPGHRGILDLRYPGLDLSPPQARGYGALAGWRVAPSRSTGDRGPAEGRPG
jgi:hypothetical protein